MTPPAGTQAERTVLAWDRTAVAVLGSGALLLVRGLRCDGGPSLAAAGLALLAALAVAVLGRRRARLVDRPSVPVRSGGGLVVATGAAVVAVGVAATVVLLVAASGAVGCPV